MFFFKTAVLFLNRDLGGVLGSIPAVFWWEAGKHPGQAPSPLEDTQQSLSLSLQKPVQAQGKRLHTERPPALIRPRLFLVWGRLRRLITFNHFSETTLVQFVSMAWIVKDIHAHNVQWERSVSCGGPLMEAGVSNCHFKHCLVTLPSAPRGPALSSCLLLQVWTHSGLIS